MTLMFRKIPFGSGASRFADDFPQINCLPGPGSYDWESKSIRSSPSKSTYVDIQRRRPSRFDSPRNSIITQTATAPEIREKPIKPKKSPMKSCLSTMNKSTIQKPKLKEEGGNTVFIFVVYRDFTLTI